MDDFRRSESMDNKILAEAAQTWLRPDEGAESLCLVIESCASEKLITEKKAIAPKFLVPWCRPNSVEHKVFTQTLDRIRRADSPQFKETIFRRLADRLVELRKESKVLAAAAVSAAIAFTAKSGSLTGSFSEVVRDIVPESEDLAGFGIVALHAMVFSWPEYFQTPELRTYFFDALASICALCLISEAEVSRLCSRNIVSFGIQHNWWHPVPDLTSGGKK